MRKVTFTEAILNPVRVFEAATNGPIVITQRNRNAAVVLSVAEYERLTTRVLGPSRRAPQDVEPTLGLRRQRCRLPSRLRRPQK